MAEQRPLSVDLLQAVTVRLEQTSACYGTSSRRSWRFTKPETEERPSTSSWARLSNLSVSVLLGYATTRWPSSIGSKAHVPGIFDKNLRMHRLGRSVAREAIEKPLITGLISGG